MSYCSYIQSRSGTHQALHKAYHDHHYGFPIHDDNELFGRLILEINQAGLSWETILKKRRTSGPPTAISPLLKSPPIPKQTGSGF